MNSSLGKIGIGIVTTDRPEFFAKCIKSMPQVDTIVIINNGQKDIDESLLEGRNAHVIKNNTRESIGANKNQALRYLMQDGCDHLFIAEDDIEIIDPTVCEKYIETAAISGIWHLNYALSGKLNKTKENEPNPKQIITYGDKQVALYHHCVGSWSYYYAGIIRAVGYMDERYKNALEHVDHTYRIILESLHPPFWWFADIADSDKYIRDLDVTLEGSSIRKDPKWISNFNTAAGWFMNKFGFPVQAVPEQLPEHVSAVLTHLRDHYARDKATAAE